MRRREHHVDIAIIPISFDIMDRQKEVEVCFDVIFMNFIAFGISISRNTKSCTVEALDNRIDDTLIASIQEN